MIDNDWPAEQFDYERILPETLYFGLHSFVMSTLGNKHHIGQLFFSVAGFGTYKFKFDGCPVSEVGTFIEVKAFVQKELENMYIDEFGEIAFRGN